MKIIQKKYNFIPLFLILFGLSAVLSSCSVFETEQDCEPKLKFIFDMNMSGGDGFPAQVESVDVWIFDSATGDFVAKYSDSGKALTQKGYTLTLNGLQPGTYDFIVWGGLKGSESFEVPSIVTDINDLKCTMATVNKNGENTSSSLLSPLFYGKLIGQNLQISHTYTVPLIKDTNNINISLQHLSDEPLDASDFTIYMTDANSNLNYDNSVLNGPTIYYYPWSEKSGVIDMEGDDLNYLQAEISTCRLMSDRNPLITIIDNATGKIVYQIPIVEWAKKLRSLQNLSMDDQEYLDREHEYTVMLYLAEEPEGWRAVSIVINGYQM